jgi:hypothetical protein
MALVVLLEDVLKGISLVAACTVDLIGGRHGHPRAGNNLASLSDRDLGNLIRIPFTRILDRGSRDAVHLEVVALGEHLT